jgi:hypothetical protein
MTFVLHTQVYTPTEGMMPGGAYAITEKGLEVWSGGDLELLVV